MKQYHDLLADVLANGKERTNRIGVNTLAVFGRGIRHDLQEGFPLVTTKEIHTKSFVHELLWFLIGDRNMNVKYLQDNGVRIWNEWADEDGDLGPIYGAQWRNWYSNHWNEYIDQLANVIKLIKNEPNDRRLLVSAWNPSDMQHMQLPPCHYAFQFYVEDGKLSCLFTMRSVDLFLGLPFDIGLYALLTHMVAQVTGLDVGELIGNFGDTHIYTNHIEQIKIQLEREHYPLPNLVLDPTIKDIDEFRAEHISFVDYVHHPKLKGKVAK